MSEDRTNPAYYRTGLSDRIECIDICRHLPFALGNACKYVWRAGGKEDAALDLDKAVWYLTDYSRHPVRVPMDAPAAMAKLLEGKDAVGRLKIECLCKITAGYPRSAIKVIERLKKEMCK